MGDFYEDSRVSVRICALFPDRMNLYGEGGNLKILCRRLEEMGCLCRVDCYEGEEPAPNWMDYDLLYLGSGTEEAQQAALKLLFDQSEALADYVESGRMFLVTGNGTELLGHSLTTRTGEVLSGLGLADFQVEQTDRRLLGDVVGRYVGEEMPQIVGFINCCGIIKGRVETPFAELSFGKEWSNDGIRAAEGYQKKRLIATRMIGPLLVRNPQFLEQIVFWLGEEKGVTPNEPDRKSAQWEAYRRSVAGLSERMLMHNEK